MSLELGGLVISDIQNLAVSISFGDLMSLELCPMAKRYMLKIGFNLLWRSNVVGTRRY